MNCDAPNCGKPIAADEQRVDVKDVSERTVKRYHAACAAAVIAPQAVAAPSTPST